MEEKWGEKKHTQGKRVRKAVQAQEGIISDKSSYHRSELGNRNRHYSVAKDNRGRVSHTAVLIALGINNL
jgi:hypothetical protein